MKHLNIVVFVIAAAAVLVAAYAVGLLVRQVRLSHTEPSSQQLAEPNATARRDAVAESRRINRPNTQTGMEERAKLKEERAKELAKMQNMTAEEEQQFRDGIRRQFSAGADRQRQALSPSPERLAEIARRQALMRMRDERQEEQATQAATLDANEPSLADTAAEQATEEGPSEPNETDQN